MENGSKVGFWTKEENDNQSREVLRKPQENKVENDNQSR